MIERLPEVACLLPHQPPMRLLDRVTSWRDGQLQAEVDVVPGAAFCQPGRGIPAWIGLEYLSQAAAACFGLMAGAGGTPPRPGMLVACRRFDTRLASFPEAVTLTVKAWATSPVSASLVRFAGEILLDGPIATGEVSVYLARDRGAAP
jgi:predicted hotdog family 3-hydroxylacyl-ACP dehydratase